MDITQSVQPNSQQINADDLTKPVTVTIEGVTAGDAEQPVHIRLAEFPGRTYRPGKSMRRVLIAAWGSEATAYVGRRLTLFNDPTVKWAGQAVGGIRISHMSHIEKPLSIALTVTRGSRKPFSVQPLADAPARDWLKELDLAGADVTALAALGAAAKTAGASEDILTKIRDKYTAAKKGEL